MTAQPIRMNSWKTCCIGALCFLLAGAAAVISKQRGEIAGLRSRASAADQELARQTTAQADLEKDLQQAQARAKELAAREKPALEPAQEPARDLTKPNIKKRDHLVVDDSQVTTDMAVKQWVGQANDPDVMRRLATQARVQTLKRYGELFMQLNVPPEQTEQFTKLLTDKRQAPVDVAVASYQNGEDPWSDPAGLQEMTRAARAEIESQIHSLLGDANYERYLDFNRLTGLSNVTSLLDQALRNAGAPLTADQTARFQQVLVDNETSRVTAKVVSDSKDFLSPAQVQALRDLRAIQQANSRKRNQPLQILPATPRSQPAASKHSRGNAEAFANATIYRQSLVKCRSLLAGDSQRTSTDQVSHRLQAGSYKNAPYGLPSILSPNQA
jgi:hypothetical protein